MSNKHMRGQQSGFTLIELVVVIVILGILAATALPRFADMSTDARMAKANAAVAALKTGSSLFHAQWLVSGSPTDTSTTVSMDGQSVSFVYGYPDVNSAGTAAGIALAAGGLDDYSLSTSATDISVATDAAHPNCAVIYTQSASTGNAPVINVTGITTSNCS